MFSRKLLAENMTSFKKSPDTIVCKPYCYYYSSRINNSMGKPALIK